jgi:uncharacterized membrane protein
VETTGDRRAEEPTEEPLDLERREHDVEAASTEQEQPSEGVFAAQYKSHSGPLPDHDWFAGLEVIHPGATEIILRDFTEERVHQRKMQEKAIDLDTQVFLEFSRYQRSRLWMAGGLALFLAAGGLALIFFDKAIYGFVLLVSEIAVLAGVFFARRASEEDDLDDLDDEDLDQMMAELEEGED